MIGLGFLAVGLLWLAFSWYMAARLPKWLGIAKPVWRWVIGAVVLLMLLVGPFVDHIVGMRQFERLCEERTVMRLTADAKQVTRARRVDLPTFELQGYWVRIRSSPVSFVNVDTNREFLRYEILNTSGGRIAGIALLGGSHQCVPKDYGPVKDLDIDRLLEQGK